MTNSEHVKGDRLCIRHARSGGESLEPFYSHGPIRVADTVLIDGDKGVRVDGKWFSEIIFVDSPDDPRITITQNELRAAFGKRMHEDES